MKGECNMFKKGIVMVLALCMTLCASSCFLAEEADTAPKPRIIATSDGVLSIEAPSDEWEVTVDPNHWFAMTDGTNTITIEHLSNGESLPATAVADETYAGVYQAFVSTRNEVFAIKGKSVQVEDLESVMKAISTIKILQFNTKTAVSNNETTAASFSISPINKTFYVIGDEVNVRLGCSMDDQVIGTKYYKEEVYVNGSVQKNGVDTGWYQIDFNNSTGYVSSAFLSETAPQGNYSSAAASASASTSASTSAAGSSGSGNYAIDSANGTQDPSAPGQAYCIYCGKYYEEGNVYRNHVCPARDAAYAAGENAIDSVNGTQDPSAPGQVYCIYCGQYYPEGNEYRNHICPARDEAYAGYAVEPVSGTQDPEAEENYAIDSVDGTQDPYADGNYAIDSVDGTQDPYAG